MKKERNAFFQNQSSSSYYYPTSNIPMNMPMQNYPGSYPMATESNSSFYQGPIINQVPVQQSDYNTEIEARLAKIERQISRLDTRLTKLESEMNTSYGTNTDYNSNSMYMV